MTRKPTKVMVIGSTGMLGHVVTSYLVEKREIDVINVAFRTKFDKNTASSTYI